MVLLILQVSTRGHALNSLVNIEETTLYLGAGIFYTVQVLRGGPK